MKTKLLTCKTCGYNFPVTLMRGRPPRYCSKLCRAKSRATPTTRKTCVMCERTFEAKNKGRKTCSAKCKRLRANNRRQTKVARMPNICNCVVCGEVFISRRPGGKTCSSECRKLWQNQRSRETRENGTPTPCRFCGKVFKAHPQKGKECCSAKCRIAISAVRTVAKNLKSCDLCASALTATEYRRNSGMCSLCKTAINEYRQHKDVIKQVIKQIESQVCYCCDCGGRFTHIKNKSRVRCGGCTTKRAREISRASHKETKHRRRARKKGATVERFTSLELFNRDGWKCQLCGCRVRKYKTMNHPREATIDHIIPLSRGGKHALVNCQTACRQCNTIKGAKTKGQLRLI